MTWSCPNCSGRYPDSAIGVPEDKPADEKDGCKVCFISPMGTSEFKHPREVPE
jgi:hypothetical protein